MRLVGIREYYFIDIELSNKLVEIGLWVDRNTIRVELASKGGRVPLVVDAGDLGGRERNDLVIGVVAIDDVEIVEVTARQPP